MAQFVLWFTWIYSNVHNTKEILYRFSGNYHVFLLRPLKCVPSQAIIMCTFSGLYHAYLFRQLSCVPFARAAILAAWFCHSAMTCFSRQLLFTAGRENFPTFITHRKTEYFLLQKSPRAGNPTVPGRHGGRTPRPGWTVRPGERPGISQALGQLFVYT